MHIGVLGGTFDPIHVGHCQLAWEAMHLYHFTAVHFIPNAVPPHRSQPQASAEDRVAMVKIAIANEPLFVCNRLEIDRQGPSYMVDTLASLREQYPDAAITLILGMDAFAQLSQWYEYERLLSLAHIVVCHRPDAPACKNAEAALIQRHQKPDNTPLTTQPAGFIDVFTPLALLDISSSGLRQWLNQEKFPHFILPEGVSDYISSKGLYKIKGGN
ncbi:MAG: nicotinic acid mononucleotide adenylyltransferase [Legionellales bacterium]|nr:nicotinic acid mononucleotide adenylyltransferase [Legionellales bacterium]|tara:strand:- start:367 stop:1011 length:645 start_codon:yes stop_codon:yes gene_type:complete